MITNRTLQSLKPGAVVWGDRLPGFGARRQKSAVSFVLKYRLHGLQRFVTLGRYGVLTPDEARRKARQILGSAAGGIDAVKPKGDAVAAVVTDYLGYASTTQRASSFGDTQRYLRVHWRSLHHMPLASVTRRDIAKGLAEISADHSGVVAARARAALSAMFNWAIREGYEIPVNPVMGTNRPAEPASRSRVLTDAEISRLWLACGDDDFGRIIRLLLLTAQRRDEIGKLRRNEIDLDQRLIRLPPARTKNNSEHIIPLSPLALSLLPPACGDFVFVGRGFSAWSRHKARLDERAGISDWRIHDLRRSAATIMADRLGVLPHIVEAILNHSGGHKAGVAGIYNRSRYLVPMREALERWADYVVALTT
jgi:integrase